MRTLALPGYEAGGDVRQSGYGIDYGRGRIQDSVDDLTGSSTGHLDIKVTRPTTGDQRAVYVYTQLVDGVNNPTGASSYPIESFQRLDPGDEITVTEKYVEQFRYPPDGGPRQTLVETNTYALYAVFSRDPFAGDKTPPTVPKLELTGVTAHTATLHVSGGTDNVGVVAYEIYRDGVSVTRVSVEDTTVGVTYTDSPLGSERLYSYTARAYDLAGNASAATHPLLASTGVNHAPIISGYSIDAADAETGEIDGHVTAYDPDGDEVFYYVSDQNLFPGDVTTMRPPL